MDSYRYGFQGMEGDNEVKGIGNSYTTEFRQFDSRIGRWQTIDRLSRKQPSLSPYNFVNNNPIFRIDKDGLEDFTINRKGEIKSTGKGLDCDTDRLIAGKAKYNENGDLKNSKRKIKEVEKGALQKRQEPLTENGDKKTIIQISDPSKAEDIFKFVAKNTDVEFALTNFKLPTINISVISTSHQYTQETSAIDVIEHMKDNEGVPTSHTHNHSTFLDDNGVIHVGSSKPSGTDESFRTTVKSMFIGEKIEFYIYKTTENKSYPYPSE